MKSSAYIADDENVLLVRFKHPHLDNWETDGPSVLPMGLAPVVVRMFPMVAGSTGLSAPHFGTSYQGYSSARMTSDSSVEKCGGANEVSCDWVRLHIFVAGKVNDKARVKLAKGAHPPSSAAHCLTGVCRTWRSTTMTNRPLAPLLLAGSASFSNNLFLYLLTTPLPLQ